MDVVKTLNELIEGVNDGDIYTLAELQRELIYLNSELKQLALCSVSSSLSVGDDKADELIDKTIEKHKLKDIGSLTKKQCLRVGIAVGLMEEKLLKP